MVSYNSPMRAAAKFLTAGVFALLIAVTSPSAPPAAEAQGAPNGAGSAASGQPPGGGQQPTPTFRASVDLITTDMIARDQRSEQFISDLKPEEIEIYEDGVKQQIVSFILTHGGRVFNEIGRAHV